MRALISEIRKIVLLDGCRLNSSRVSESLLEESFATLCLHLPSVPLFSFCPSWDHLEFLSWPFEPTALLFLRNGYAMIFSPEIICLFSSIHFILRESDAQAI